MANLLEAVQDEAKRVREMIANTKVALPNGNLNFVIYERTLDAADKAV